MRYKGPSCRTLTSCCRHVAAGMRLTALTACEPEGTSSSVRRCELGCAALCGKLWQAARGASPQVQPQAQRKVKQCRTAAPLAL